MCNGRRTTRFQKRYGRRDVHYETTGGKETGGTGEYGSLGFIYPQEAYDTVPRDTAMATLRWMGVPKDD